MFKHFIAISSLYSKGIRIAWHYSSEKLDARLIEDFLTVLKKKHGDVQLGIHKITTDSSDWDSVVENDSYFKGLCVVKDKKEFIDLISSEQKLGAIDVAKYILTIDKMSPLKLQKLLYLSYERFLKLTGERLFKDSIYAWKHGPVIETVYEEFKEYGANAIPYEEDDNVIIVSSDLTVSPSFMKIFSSEHGKTAMEIILSVLDDYSSLTAWDLVDLTHQEGKPWKQVYKPGANKLITDEIISAYA